MTAAEKLDSPKRICPLSTGDVIDRIIMFTQELGQVRLYTYQRLFCQRIAQSVLDNDGATITGLWSRQCGKTETIANIAIALCVLLPCLAREFPDDDRFKAFARGFYVGVYAPVSDQADISFSRMRQKLNSDEGQAILADPELNAEVTTNRGNTVAFSNGSSIIARTASEESQIEGKTHHLVFCEEAQKLSRAKVEKEIRPMLASTNGSMVCIGTAWISRGGFHQSIQYNEELHKNGGPRNHFEFPYDLVCAERQRAYEKDKNPYHLNYEKFVNSEIRRLGGTDSEEFKMNFRCLWQESRLIAISMRTLDNAMLKHIEAGPSRFGIQVAGLDVGKLIDSTVLTVMHVDYENPIINTYTMPDSDEDKQVYRMKTIVDWLELGGPFEGSAGQYRRLVEYLQQTSVQVLCIDATTMGDPVFERIEAMVGGTIVCIPYKFSSMSKNLLYKYYLQELNAGRVRYAAGQMTQERVEFRKFRYEHLELDKEEFGGYVVCQAPEGGHDDYPDSAALAAWAEKMADEVLMPEIQTTSASSGGGQGRWGSRGGSSSSGPPAGGRGGRYGRRR